MDGSERAVHGPRTGAKLRKKNRFSRDFRETFERLSRDFESYNLHLLIDCC